MEELWGVNKIRVWCGSFSLGKLVPWWSGKVSRQAFWWWERRQNWNTIIHCTEIIEEHMRRTLSELRPERRRKTLIWMWRLYWGRQKIRANKENTVDETSMIPATSYKCIVSVFSDLKKAFDTVDNSILLWKMFHISFRSDEFEWFCE